MNKKTLSRVAALSLACAAVVPTFSIAASADVNYYVTADAQRTISGTALYQTWIVQETTTTYTATVTTNTNGITNYSITNNAVTTILNPTDEVNNANGVLAQDVNYYASTAYAKKASGLVDEQIKIASTTAASDLKTWQNQWSDYKKYADSLVTYATKADGTYYYNDSTGKVTVTVTSGSVSSDATQISAPASTCTTTTYSYLVAPNPTSVTMNQLVAALSTSIVDIDTNGVITGNSASGKWKINTADSATGTTGTTTNTTTTTNVTYSTPASSYRTASNTVYRSSATGMYYPNLSALRNVEGSGVSYTTRAPYTYYSSTYCYFDPVDGTYRASNTGTYTYKVNSNDTTAIYKVGSYYYATYSDAYSAASGDTSKITYVRDYTGSYGYFSNVTGSFYSTYYAALSASGGNSSLVDLFNGATADYTDPYYYWYTNQGYTTTTTTSSDSSSATMGKKSGWTAIAKSLSSTKSGNVTVKMNDEDTIPSSVISAIKGKDVTVSFVLDNGVTYKVNGEDVTTAKSVNIDTTYNTKNVSKSLVKAAVKKNDGVSSAQLSIDASSLGFTSDVTIKLSSKRAGYSAKLYRYNSSKNSLVLVDSATIKSNGKCTFENVTKGGDFVVVVY